MTLIQLVLTILEINLNSHIKSIKICIFSVCTDADVNVCYMFPQGMYIKSTYDGLHVITGTTEGVSADLFVFIYLDVCTTAHALVILHVAISH